MSIDYCHTDICTKTHEEKHNTYLEATTSYAYAYYYDYYNIIL